ncbi:MAG: D-TA family PLP-dependent enzyme [Saprospiraceae bacterium]|nr:D-TA family PLP-dependent enzyme [Saprospiraceae bacterium]
MENFWYQLANESEVDSPTLLVYKDRVQYNIQKMIDIIGNPERLMVHIKTNKTPEILQMLLAAGITRFKCATVAEAEMAAIAGAKYIVIAHQLVGPKIERLIQLRKLYPEVFIASLLDDHKNIIIHNDLFKKANLIADIFIDINNGMDRSGHPVNKKLIELYQFTYNQSNIHLHGLHVYDGHLRDRDFSERKDKIDSGFETVHNLTENIEKSGLPTPLIIAGGTPAFTSHATRAEVYCSPGTCVLWDWGYGDQLSEQNFEHAALILTRVISKPAPGIITIDLGHKAVAAENPIDKRIRFLNLHDYELISQSEEHGVLKVKNWEDIKIGDAFYGVPYHICPTVNLYEEMQVINDGKATETWQVVGRKRKITV